jgi:hypothetical protein
MKFVYFARNDLVKVGLTEFGEDEFSLLHYIVAESPDGRRWNHFYREVRKGYALPPRMARLFSNIKAAGTDPRNSGHWAETAPRYGSEAYSSQELMYASVDRALDEEENRHTLSRDI